MTDTPIGRIVVPPFVPDGFSLFYTTIDFHGRITPDIAIQLAALTGIESTLATCNQVHGANVVEVPRASEWRECQSCDALWTEQRGKALAIKIADCLPVTLIDPKRHVIANIHSGWRGAAQNIVAKTLDVVPMQGLAYLGPSIRVCCFEVGEEVAEQFPEEFVARSHAKPHVDLPAFTTRVLREGGLEVFDSGLCTRCDGSIFHSYRRDQSGGRNLAIVAQ